MQDNHNEDKDDRDPKDGGGGNLEASRGVVELIATSGSITASGLLGNLSSNNSGSGRLYNKKRVRKLKWKWQWFNKTCGGGGSLFLLVDLPFSLSSNHKGYYIYLFKNFFFYYFLYFEFLLLNYKEEEEGKKKILLCCFFFYDNYFSSYIGKKILLQVIGKKKNKRKNFPFDFFLFSFKSVTSLSILFKFWKKE